MKTNWEMYKRQQIMSYPKRRNRKIIVIVVVVIILLLIIANKLNLSF